jgi:hypothetical protein
VVCEGKWHSSEKLLLGSAGRQRIRDQNIWRKERWGSHEGSEWQVHRFSRAVMVMELRAFWFETFCFGWSDTNSKLKMFCSSHLSMLCMFVWNN